MVPEETTRNGAHGVPSAGRVPGPSDGGYAGGYDPGRDAGAEGGYPPVGAGGNGYQAGYDQGPDYGQGAGYEPGYVPVAGTRPEDVGGVSGDGARRHDSGGPDEPGAAGGGGDSSGGEPAHAAERKPRSFWKELPLLIGIALVLALIIKTFLVQAFSIPSDSMNNTLLKGDRVLVDKLTPWFGSTPSRGEVVVFHDPGGWLPENPPPSSNPAVRGLQKTLSFVGLMPSAEEKDLIKRVIGVGGDTVSCKGTGPVMVNGKPLNEPYVFPGNTPCTPDMPFTVHVPKGRIWVMGDHRQDSLDSRYHVGMYKGKHTDGTVSTKQVVGRAVVVAWPINRWDWLGIPGTFSQSGINAAGTAGPAAVGVAGAIPLVMLRRRRLLRKHEAAGASEGAEG
ncbi:signal peptidase I [Streptomyces sp. NBC_00669]|uniref:signal peptidase I n=1 Tax=Streptomyces sp. NBC_00669 TaxID=2976011 RepID=UPI003FA6CEDD